jgi:hypothetical protein
MIKILVNTLHFKIVAEALGMMFDMYNKQCGTVHVLWEIVSNVRNSNHDIYIVFTPWKLDKMPKHYIFYNFEQLNISYEGDDFTHSDKFEMILQNSIQNWDYSLSNINYLKEKHENISVIFFPFGWCGNMKNSTKTLDFNNRPNTILFTGAMNERRRNILKPIHTLCSNRSYGMFLSSTCWNEQYIDICSKSKIALNIHYYEGQTILEVHRIIPLVLNDIFVISERSNDEFYDELMSDIVLFIDEHSNAKEITEHILELESHEIKKELNTRKRLLIERCSYYKNMTDNIHMSIFHCKF